MRKLVSGILALGLAVTTVVSAVASAAGSFIDGKDPNGDGYLSLADSTYIQMVLSGKYRPSDLTKLDVDDNGVVSNADVYMTQLAELGYYNNVSETEDATSPMNVAAGSTSRSYNIYNAKTGTYKRTYSLSVEDDDNAAETYGIFPPDDRQEDWSNRGAAKIITNTSYGSGFVVGKHTIATAAHVVFDTENDTPKNIESVLLFGINQTAQPLKVVEYHVPNDFIDIAEYNWWAVNYDYALITVEDDLSAYNSFNLGIMTDSAVNHHITVATVGFPVTVGSQNENNDNKHKEFLSFGSIKSFENDSFHHTADTSGGNSGGPVYVTETVGDKIYYTVVGVNAASCYDPDTWIFEDNMGMRFTSETLKFYNGNTNIQY